MHYLKTSNTNDYNEFEVSYLCIIQSITYFHVERCIDWLHNRHKDWLGTRHDWLGLCPTIPNLGYATAGHSLSTADYSADGNVSVATGNNDTVHVVSSLRIATNYSVTIAAHTMIGIGPYSSNTDCTVQTS